MQEPSTTYRSLRFGRTTVSVLHGNVFATDASAVVCPANRRGMMVAGAAGLVRLRGGADIERDIMARAPLALGTSIATTSGDLAASGVDLVLHAVIFTDLGGTTRLDHVKHAVASALQSAERHRVRSLALPPIGAGVGEGRLDSAEVYGVIVDEIAGHLRRFSSRIGHITVACPDRADVREAFALLQHAYQLWWELRAT